MHFKPEDIETIGSTAGVKKKITICGYSEKFRRQRKYQLTISTKKKIF